MRVRVVLRFCGLVGLLAVPVARRRANRTVGVSANSFIPNGNVLLITLDTTRADRLSCYARAWLQKLVVLIAAVVSILSPGNLSLAHAQQTAASTSVILISVDTLRADHLSSYGYRRFPTPHIDSLQHGGTVFSQIDSQIPLTVPSHSSLLTSTYPFANGVEENDQRLGPDLPTLATLLKSGGYRTAAFIGGYFLARRFGLDRGFDVYDAPFAISTDPPPRALDLKRPAEAVVGDAERWLAQNSGVPFFVFIHLFDLHQPYDPPASLRHHYGRDEYDAELGYVDEELSRFWSFLARRRIKSLIVFTADHGESRGDHGEPTHGYFIYQSTIHVPLIINWPQETAYRARVDDPAGLIDVAPTILEYLRLPVPPTFQGHSLLEFLKGGREAGAREVYSESLYAHDRLGFAPLVSLRVGNSQYIDAPKPELYGLSRDPTEADNLAFAQPALAQKLKARLRELRSRSGSGKTVARTPAGPNVTANLHSLGYLAGNGEAPSPREFGPDPKDGLREYRQYLRGTHLIETRNFRQAETLFKEMIDEDVNDLVAHYDLAVCFAGTGRIYDALIELKNALSIDPHNRMAGELMGSIWVDAGQYERARAEFKYLLSFAPQDYTAEYGLGVVADREGRANDAIRHFDTALRLQPRSARSHLALGRVYFEEHEFALAKNEFVEVARLRPRFAEAYYELGLALENQQDPRRAALAFRQALKYDGRLFAAQRELKSLRSSGKANSAGAQQFR
jgi:choline-sulfatase